MSSQVVIKDKQYKGNVSRMVESINQLAGKIDTEPSGLYDQKIKIITGNLTIDGDNLDVEFDVPFDDDTEANEAEIVIYNLSDDSIGCIKKEQSISINAGYGKDTGVIFSGYVSKKHTYWEDCERVTVIHAIDNNGKKETELTELSFSSGSKASEILKSLVEKVGLPVAAFETKRDYTYKDNVTVNGGLMENIRKYAQVCGVVAYVCKSKIYVCPLSYGQHDKFYLEADTGLLSTSEFEEEKTAEDYTDIIKGQNIEMLLQHKVQTGSIINLTAKNAKGEYRVSSGSHNFDGSTFTTTVKAISISCIK